MDPEQLTAPLDQLIKDYGDGVASGACEDFADYKFKAGFIQGIRRAKQEVLDRFKCLESAE